MHSTPPWPTSPHNPTAIRLYGVDITNITPNIEISFLSLFRKKTDEAEDDDQISGLTLEFTRKKRNRKVPSNETIAVVYAYAFEGHCYKIDKPRIMVFIPNGPAEAAVGCGFEALHDLANPKKDRRIKDASGQEVSFFPERHDPKKPEKSEDVLPGEVKSIWRMWLVDRLDRVIELDLNQGFFEELILEANMPGKRSPTTYSANMQVAHRGGRLTD